MTTSSRIGVLLLSVGAVLIAVDGFVDSWTVAQVVGLVLVVLAIVLLLAAGNRAKAAG